jgi:hypothetical protein
MVISALRRDIENTPLQVKLNKLAEFIVKLGPERFVSSRRLLYPLFIHTYRRSPFDGYACLGFYDETNDLWEITGSRPWVLQDNGQCVRDPYR